MADLLGRCWIDPDDPGHDNKAGPCWHLRTPRGRRFETGTAFGQHRLWLPAHGETSSPLRAAWLLGRPDQALDPRKVRYRACCSFDCVNPAHLRQGSRSLSIKAAVRRGALDTPARRAQIRNLTVASQAAAILNPEAKAWVVESSQSVPQLAHAMACSESWIKRVRSEGRKALAKAEAERQERARRLRAMSSIFGLAQAAGDGA